MRIRAQQPGWDSGCFLRAEDTAAHPYEAHWGVGYAASSPPEPHSRPCECFFQPDGACPAPHRLWYQLVDLLVQPSQLRPLHVQPSQLHTTQQRVFTPKQMVSLSTGPRETAL